MLMLTHMHPPPPTHLDPPPPHTRAPAPPSPPLQPSPHTRTVMDARLRLGSKTEGERQMLYLLRGLMDWCIYPPQVGGGASWIGASTHHK